MGLLLLVNGVLLIPDLSVWLTDSAVSSFQVIRENSTGGRMNLFAWLGDSPRVVSIVVASYMIAATGLLLGWQPRVMGAVVFLCLTSFTHCNPFACSSGDTLLRLMSFFFIWAPPNLPWSAGRPSERIGPVFPAVLRCMQFQVCLVYFAGFLAKLQGSMWRDGTAVHMVS